MASRKSARSDKVLQLPPTRVKTIMKIDPKVQNIGRDAVHLVTKSAELFIKHLAEKTHVFNPRKIEYCNLAEVTKAENNLEFLRKYVPKKIKVREFKKVMAAKEEKSDSDSDWEDFAYQFSNVDSDASSCSGVESKIVSENEDIEESSNNSIVKSASETLVTASTFCQNEVLRRSCSEGVLSVNGDGKMSVGSNFTLPRSCSDDEMSMKSSSVIQLSSSISIRSWSSSIGEFSSSSSIMKSSSFESLILDSIGSD